MNSQSLNIPQGLEVRIAGHEFIALPERALYWPTHRTLMIADLHLGKSDTFRSFGIAVPIDVQMHDLQRLNGLLDALKPESLVILGDFVHGAIVGSQTSHAWRKLREAHHSTRFILTRGNHDRTVLAEQWLIDDLVPSLLLGDDVLLSHEPAHSRTSHKEFSLNIHGHKHPVFRPHHWNRAMPAMVFEGTELALPAFSHFTAGVRVGGREVGFGCFR
ncbi:ligase-associated DNA damage response endonuclease PdeM [Diaphorobacter aerolatus]|uniref:Ligase-associated DNA damage response endonuclease PdeM n=1 Tax=Diaphorobacter aerolatus TaxID=1288495 RepID=A0A7H0GN08_9BURK|nr:ligase-associated DNA damage response endonuclease PdeM [Diaphorobacter aerolatus]QNP49674.1 ligase-associated DNA damage response endonuclease PdeM [Diaphorobacter aerolatus]